MSNVIDKFDGEYRFLSNFYDSPIWYGGRRYATVEHMYQAFKMITFEDHEMVRLADTPGIAKKLARRMDMRLDWLEVRDAVMLHALQLKFVNRSLEYLLLSTGDAELIEGNTWGDTYWGVCNRVGKNRLGQLLMQVRMEIRSKAALKG